LTTLLLVFISLKAGETLLGYGESKEIRNIINSVVQKERFALRSNISDLNVQISQTINMLPNMHERLLRLHEIQQKNSINAENYQRRISRISPKHKSYINEVKQQHERNMDEYTTLLEELTSVQVDVEKQAKEYKSRLESFYHGVVTDLGEEFREDIGQICVEALQTSQELVKHDVAGVKGFIKDCKGELQSSVTSEDLEHSLDIVYQPIDTSTASESWVQRIVDQRAEEVTCIDRLQVFEEVKRLHDVKAADDLGVRDYALSYGSIVRDERFTSLPSSRSHDPQAAISRSNDDCFVFEGTKGNLTLEFDRPVRPSTVSLQISSHPESREAGKHKGGGGGGTSSVNGVCYVSGNAPKAFMVWAYQSKAALIAGYGGRMISQGQYMHPSMDTIQSFELDSDPTDSDTLYLRLEIASNYGGVRTSIQRFRVHGEPIEQIKM